MTLPLQNTFEGGTSGTAISAANSGGASGDAFTGTMNTAPTFDSTHTANGGLAMLQPAAAGAVKWDSTVIGTPVDVWGRVYVFITANPGVQATTAAGLTPTSAIARQFLVRVNTTGKLSNVVTTGTAVASTTVLSLSTWYRLEFHFHTVASGTCTLDCTIYLGNSTTVTETMTQATGTGLSTDTSINQVWFGSANAVTANLMWLDDIQANTTGFPGPFGVPRVAPVVVGQAVKNAAVM